MPGYDTNLKGKNMYNFLRIKILFLLFIFIITINLYSKDTLSGPNNPDEPNIDSIDIGEDKDSNNKEYSFNIEYQKQNGNFGKGVLQKISNIYLNLSWEGNQIGSQEILLDFIKSLRVKGYTMVKKQRKKLGVIFYFPYVFDIELNDGKIIKDAKGRIKELESFLVYNAMGREKCYTYFVRYWLEDKKIFNDNMSSDYNETPKVPDSVIIYLEFRDKK